MKAGIHPDYQQTTIRCACGNVIETGSTKKDIRVEVCSTRSKIAPKRSRTEPSVRLFAYCPGNGTARRPVYCLGGMCHEED